MGGLIENDGPADEEPTVGEPEPVNEDVKNDPVDEPNPTAPTAVEDDEEEEPQP